MKTIEYILLSITVVHSEDSCGQVDDAAAGILKRELLTYHGINFVEANVLYKHTKREQHPLNCSCHFCTLSQQAGSPDAQPSKPNQN